MNPEQFEIVSKKGDNTTLSVQFGNYHKKLAFPQQVHSDCVKSINSSGIYKNCDGIITSSRELVIRIKVADCVPVFIHDPVRKINGLIHSGWRGTVKKIVLKAVQKFLAIGSDMKDLRIVLGPSIKMRNYIVQKDVASYFTEPNKTMIMNGWKVSLAGEIMEDLINNGFRKEQIFTSDICSFETKECHSFRRDQEKSGRMHAYMGFV